jgi:adenylate cyclase
LAADFLRTVTGGVTIAMILVFSLVVGFFVMRLRALHAIFVSLLLLLLYFLIAFSLFDRGILPDLLYPPLSIVASFAGTSVCGVIIERSEKRKITQTIGRYLSPSVVEKILSAMSRGGLKLGGEEQEATILFADVRGFSRISRQMPPRNLVELLNKHISLVIKAVLENDGLVNKFGGDSIMAVWNAPVRSQDHALLAIKAALSAQYYIGQLSRHEAGPGMEFGIGINTGRVLAGNMGSPERLEYTVIGDAVNIAARLADAVPGGKVWIGANTAVMEKDRIEVRPLEPLSVKGGDQTLQAFEVLKILNERPDAGGS